MLKHRCVAQAAPTPSAVATPASGAQQDHPSPMPASHSAGIKSLQGVESPATFQVLPTEVLPVAPAAATSHTSPSPLPSKTGPELHSSPILLDLQTSVSPMLVSQPQPIVENMVPMPGVTAPEVMSPVALAPSSTAQSEAPTPTLLPKGSTVGSPAGSAVKEALNGSSPVVLAADSPRNILSSLQQMNLQSRPFDFDGNAQDGMSPSVPEQTPEPEVEASDSSQQGASGPTLEQTPEPFVRSTYKEVIPLLCQSTIFAALCEQHVLLSYRHSERSSIIVCNTLHYSNNLLGSCSMKPLYCSIIGIAGCRLQMRQVLMAVLGSQTAHVCNLRQTCLKAQDMWRRGLRKQRRSRKKGMKRCCQQATFPAEPLTRTCRKSCGEFRCNSLLLILDCQRLWTSADFGMSVGHACSHAVLVYWGLAGHAAPLQHKSGDP